MVSAPSLRLTVLLFCTLISGLSCGQDAVGKPDLVIDSIRVEGETPQEGQGVNLLATVRNQGDAPTPEHTTISVTYFDITSDSKGKMLTYGSQFKQSLPAGQTAEIKVDAPWKPMAGTYKLRAVVDDVKRIDDKDRANNILEQEITIQKNPDIEASLKGDAAPSDYQPSSNEVLPNGNFAETDPKLPFSEGSADVVTVDDTRALLFKGRFVLGWDAPDKVIAGADYVFSFRGKALGVSGTKPNASMNIFLWACYPTLHEPPKDGAIPIASWKDSFNWKKFQKEFRMPLGVSRFVGFFNSDAENGWTYLSDISLRPVDDHPLEIPGDAPVYGDSSREQMTWIWSSADFPWPKIFVRGRPQMGRDQSVPATAQTVWFRRSVSVPQGFKEAQVTFVGDDTASLEINGKEIGRNGSLQDIQNIDIQKVLKPGENDVVFKVDNSRGPGGLLGRIEWKTADGKAAYIPTNASWEASSDQGSAWVKAAAIAVPAPLSTKTAWVYPHLPLLSYSLSYDLPQPRQGVRLAVRSPGGFRVFADNKEVYATMCASHTMKVDLTDELANARTIRVDIDDIGQPPLGSGLLQVKTAKGWQDIPFSEFRHDGGKPTEVASAFFSTKTWPTAMGSFEAATSRPMPDFSSRLEPWAVDLLQGAKQIFQLGSAQDTSDAFGSIKGGPDLVTLPVSDLKDVSKGLESKLLPETTLKFTLSQAPANGAAFVLGVEDADAMVTSVGVFVNGVLSGMPQVIGYDLVPGERLTNRAWVVTIPKERLQAGENTVTLRILPPYYQSGNAVQNQSEEYIQMMGLRGKGNNPYTGSWLHWNYLALYALGKPAAEPINGRPVWMGTNLGYLHHDGGEPWRQYAVRDLSYIGLVGTQAPIRYGVWNAGELNKINRPEGAPSGGETTAEYQLKSLVEAGMAPHLLNEPGRGITSLDQLADSHEAKILRDYGKYFASYEIGNEVDEPIWGWDSLKIADAYSTIQRQAVAAQAFRKMFPELKFTIIGQGWYHAWDFSVIDAQFRKEAPNDPGFTDDLSTHNYAKSYIIPAVGYNLLYGSNAPAPIWTTECGAYSSDREDATEFDANIRGNLAFATYIIQYVCHAGNDEFKHFSLFLSKDKDAKVMERARSYRRLVHSFGLHGKPLTWTYANPDAMKDKLVYINPVDAGKWIKISFVSYSHDPEEIDVSVVLPKSGKFQATRYGDGRIVEEGIRTATIEANPTARFKETLAPGETVEYLIAK